MHIFISAGEPSGDLHAGNLVREILAIDPSIRCTGFGGPKLQAAGCSLIYPLVNHAVVGIFNILGAVPRYFEILGQAKAHFRAERPDCVVLVDYPGFHWWLAAAAKAEGIPVFYFVPPQLWGWAGWRIRKMRRLVDEALTSLPFEDDWYRARGMKTFYMGHPFYDAIAQQSLDEAFIDLYKREGRNIIGLLPGSRTQEVRNNWKCLRRAAAIVHAEEPEARFLVACFRQSHFDSIQAEIQARGLSYVTPCLGKTPEIISLAHGSLSVSGSVSLELLHQAKPFAVLYKITPIHLLLYRLMRQTPYITLVNLLADRQVIPEYVCSRCPGKELAGHAIAWLRDKDAYQANCLELESLRFRFAKPGACARAASYLLGRIAHEQPVRGAA